MDAIIRDVTIFLGSEPFVLKTQLNVPYEIISPKDFGYDAVGTPIIASRQYIKDIKSLRKARALGWIVDQVVKEDRRDEIVERARTALVSRGWRP